MMNGSQITHPPADLLAFLPEDSLIDAVREDWAEMDEKQRAWVVAQQPCTELAMLISDYVEARRERDSYFGQFEHSVSSHVEERADLIGTIETLRDMLHNSVASGGKAFHVQRVTRCVLLLDQALGECEEVAPAHDGKTRVLVVSYPVGEPKFYVTKVAFRPGAPEKIFRITSRAALTLLAAQCDAARAGYVADVTTERPAGVTAVNRVYLSWRNAA